MPSSGVSSSAPATFPFEDEAAGQMERPYVFFFCLSLPFFTPGLENRYRPETNDLAASASQLRDNVSLEWPELNPPPCFQANGMHTSLLRWTPASSSLWLVACKIRNVEPGECGSDILPCLVTPPTDALTCRARVADLDMTLCP